MPRPASPARLVRPARAAVAAAALAGCAAAEVQVPPPGAGRGPQIDPAILAEEPVAGRWQRLRVASMATTFELVLPTAATTAPATRAAVQRALAAIAEVERQANEWRSDAPLAQLNRAAGGDYLAVPEDLWALLALARSLAEATQGAFDPTWAALWGLWDFRPGADPRVPAPAEVQARRGLVGWRDLQLRAEDRSARLARAGMAVGLGGIAKGWALDRAAAELRRAGIGDFLLSAGGQVLAGGSRDGEPWTVGLRHPRQGRDAVWGYFPLQDGESLSTSGDYERFWLRDGVRYHHILDPRSGYPAGLGRADWPHGVAVLARGAAQADALSTAALVLGPQAEALIAPLCLGIFAYGANGPRLSGPRAAAVRPVPGP